MEIHFNDRAGIGEKVNLVLNLKTGKHFPALSTDLAIPFDQGARAGVLLDLIARPTLDHLGWFYSIGMMFRGLLWDGVSASEGENRGVFVIVLFASVSIPCICVGNIRFLMMMLITSSGLKAPFRFPVL